MQKIVKIQCIITKAKLFFCPETLENSTSKLLKHLEKFFGVSSWSSCCPTCFQLSWTSTCTRVLFFNFITFEAMFFSNYYALLLPSFEWLYNKTMIDPIFVFILIFQSNRRTNWISKKMLRLHNLIVIPFNFFHDRKQNFPDNSNNCF